MNSASPSEPTHEHYTQAGYHPHHRTPRRRHPRAPRRPHDPGRASRTIAGHPVATARAAGRGAAERLTEQHNVRIRPSIKSRLGKAVDKLRYETGDRTISIASITDQALDAYLTQHGC